jgi:hypothetical protein
MYFVGIGGIWIGMFIAHLRAVPLVPLKDPENLFMVRPSHVGQK